MWKLFVNVLMAGALMCGLATTAAAAASDSARSVLEWQVLPGESLNSLAVLFYPKDRRMQQRFVAATVALNRDRLQNVPPGQAFEQETTLQIPSLLALSHQAGKARKPAARKPATPAKPAMQEGPQATAPAAAPSAPASKEQTAAYQALEKRAAQRQQELEKLNQRLKSLEENTKTLQESIKANSQPLEEAQGRRLKRLD